MYTYSQSEPGAPPPMDSAVPDYGAAAEGLASGSWWESMNLTIFGKKVTNEQAKTIIYLGAAALVVLTVALVVALSGDGGAGGGVDVSGQPPSTRAGSPGVGGVIIATTERGEKNPSRVDFGSQCEFQSGGTRTDCSGAAGARCGITPNGEVYAWIMADVRDCTNPVCAPAEGPPVRYGCSRATAGDAFIECCVAIELPGTVDCGVTIDTTTDFAVSAQAFPPQQHDSQAISDRVSVVAGHELPEQRRQHRHDCRP